MRSFWIILVCVIVVAATALYLRGPETEEERLERETDVLLAQDSERTERDSVGQVAPKTDDGEIVPANSQPQTQPAEVEQVGPAIASGDAPAQSAPASQPSADGGAREGISDGLNIKIVHAEVKPGNIVRAEDGSLRVDDRFTLVGDGTKEHPYRLTWEYLISASETYQPRLSQFQMPQRIAMLHDKWVSIEGNIAFPLAATSPREILAMLNMWDGCCIGVPPSAYDAIEVRLVEAVPGTRRHTMTYGTVTGRLSVEPYLMESWLVGIYVMNEASLEQGL